MENTTNSPPRSRRLAFQPMSDSEGVPPHPVAASPLRFPFIFGMSPPELNLSSVLSPILLSLAVFASLSPLHPLTASRGGLSDDFRRREVRV